MAHDAGIADPPRSLGATLAHLGPGIILASSIVGSGELIATTSVGATAGFSLLWLILVGCGIKVAAQIEIGRTTLAWGRTPLAAFDRVPGPRIFGRNWIWWGWAAMTTLILLQQGGIVAGVAQSLAAAVPVSAAGRDWNRAHDELAAARIELAAAGRRGDAAAEPRAAALAAARVANAERAAAGLTHPLDTTLWAVVTGIVTAGLLLVGRYRLIERVSLVLVAGFTLVTLAALALLQRNPAWAISGAELAAGLVPSIPPAAGGRAPLAVGLAAFGIIGVGASELMIYPYWCLEKGYGRAVGQRDDSAAWAERARGWLKVMQLDAWGSMVVYTTVTIAFYLLGAATLGRLGIVPAGGEMVRSLGAMYAPVFGEWAQNVFLWGAFAVLYSTLFVAAAGNARMVADGLAMQGLGPAGGPPGSPAAADRAAFTRRLSAVWVLVATGLAVAIGEPVAMVLASGVAQAIMLAALAVAVIWFRYRESDPRLAPSRAWDALVWISAAGFLTIGLWAAWDKLAAVAWRA
jgi:Mn2+/Fe2+ NRAMP family transporter